MIVYSHDSVLLVMQPGKEHLYLHLSLHCYSEAAAMHMFMGVNPRWLPPLKERVWCQDANESCG
jgi:hypothetical protein